MIGHKFKILNQPGILQYLKDHPNLDGQLKYGGQYEVVESKVVENSQTLWILSGIDHLFHMGDIQFLSLPCHFELVPPHIKMGL